MKNTRQHVFEVLHIAYRAVVPLNHANTSIENEQMLLCWAPFLFCHCCLSVCRFIFISVSFSMHRLLSLCYISCHLRLPARVTVLFPYPFSFPSRSPASSCNSSCLTLLFSFTECETDHLLFCKEEAKCGEHLSTLNIWKFLHGGDCSSGGREVCLLIGRAVVQSPAPSVCMSKCTLKIGIWMLCMSSWWHFVPCH